MKIKRAELWEVWWIEEMPYEKARYDEWDVPQDLVERFLAAKTEIKDVWSELSEYDPDRE